MTEPSVPRIGRTTTRTSDQAGHTDHRAPPSPILGSPLPPSSLLGAFTDGESTFPASGDLQPVTGWTLPPGWHEVTIDGVPGHIYPDRPIQASVHVAAILANRPTNPSDLYLRFQGGQLDWPVTPQIDDVAYVLANNVSGSVAAQISKSTPLNFLFHFAANAGGDTSVAMGVTLGIHVGPLAWDQGQPS